MDKKLRTACLNSKFSGTWEKRVIVCFLFKNIDKKIYDTGQKYRPRNGIIVL